MTKKETIQVLQSIEDRAVDFPYMTACDWVAIAAAKRHLENTLEVKDEVFDTNDIKDAFKAGYDMGVLQTTKKINSNIKEVNLEEEMNKWRQKHFEGIDYILDGPGEWLERASQLDIARHFFELGLKAQKL